MRKFLLSSLLAVMTLALFVAPVLAAYDYTYDLTTDEEAAAALFGGLAIGLLVICAIGAIIGLLFLIFWIVMLVDCVKRDFNDKTLWLLILIIGFVIGLGWLAAILYYFIVRRAARHHQVPAAPQAPAAEHKPTDHTPQA